MAEWLKAAVLKTAERKFRGFESYSLRQYRVNSGIPAAARYRFGDGRAYRISIIPFGCGNNAPFGADYRQVDTG